MENENLAEMVKGQPEEATQPSAFGMDTPEKVEEDETVEVDETVKVDETVEVDRNVYDVRTASLFEWFERNQERLYPIKHVKLSVEDVNPDKNLVVSVPISSQVPERRLRIFENADDILVLDLPGLSMDIFSNGFKIVCSYSDTISAKCYGVRTGLFVVLCNNINNQLIPYSIIKIKKRDEGLNITTRDSSEILLRLNEEVDIEALKILYEQISKRTESIVTKQDAVNWFLKRQAEVTDINHHLQIDDVLIHILK